MTSSISCSSPRQESYPQNASTGDNGRNHNVVYGDTLSEIAAEHNISLEKLLQLNPQIANPDLIYPGDQIALPPQGEGATPVSAPDASGGGNQPAGIQAANQPLHSFGTPGEGVNAQQLMQIVPGLDSGKADQVAQGLNSAMAEAGITSKEEQAMFIAQLAHESAGFQYMEEIASGADYEGRSDLGNTQPGDGVRYKGRGFIQLTGRSNYEAAGAALGLDLINNPELAATPENAARVAAWYWSSRGISEIAATGDFVGVTQAINGGTNGLEDRQNYYARAREVFGI